MMAMSTFLALGCGLGLPYFVIALFPAFSRVLPRPGAWMNTFKQVLAFPMYASAAWLIWVLAQQTGADGVFVALLGMVVLAFAIWLLQLPVATRSMRTLQVGVSIATCAGAVALALTTGSQATPLVDARSAHEASEPFTQERLDSLRAIGKPVFVNLTAAWCITCKVNERIALSGDAFRAALSSGGYTYLKGDWTRQNPEITTMLESFGRAGVPLYVVYPPHGGNAVVLPQVLTQATVLQALAGHRQTVATSGDST
jgi:thiol:disulfide interchange protein DsbD